MKDGMPETPFLSVVIPARNEAENVRPLVAEVRQALDGAFDYELIYVDDGSTDATFETLKALVDGGLREASRLQAREEHGAELRGTDGGPGRPRDVARRPRRGRPERPG